MTSIPISANVLVQSLHISEPHKNKGPRKPGLSYGAKAKLATNLTLEYDLYHFVNRRLNDQLEAVQRLITNQEEHAAKKVLP